jgi:sucrose-6-phosphate hydrolase SacC (GH32 family)
MEVVDRTTRAYSHLDECDIVSTGAPLAPRVNRVEYSPNDLVAATYNGNSDYERPAIGWMNDSAYAVDSSNSTWPSAISIPPVFTSETVNERPRRAQGPPPSLRPLENSQTRYQKS